MATCQFNAAQITNSNSVQTYIRITGEAANKTNTPKKSHHKEILILTLTGVHRISERGPTPCKIKIAHSLMPVHMPVTF